MSEIKQKKLIEQDTLEAMIAKSNDTNYLAGLSDDELQKFYQESVSLQNFFLMMQSVAKELCNSVYGGLGTPSLRYFNKDLAADVTGEGRHHCQTMEKTAQQYFKNVWPKDVKWHETLRTEFPDIMRDVTPKPIIKDIVITCDTDSVDRNTIIRTDLGEISIEQLFNESKHYWNESNGTEHRTTSRKILNWTNANNLQYQEPISISRHKVSKERWKLTTESGKQIIVTGDHSLIVFRDNVKISVKASEVLLTDKILTVQNVEN